MLCLQIAIIKRFFIFKKQFEQNRLSLNYIFPKMAYAQRSNWGSFHNPEFSKLQTEIQRQTEALLRQRSNLINTPAKKFSQNQPYLKPVQSQKYIKYNSDQGTNMNQFNSQLNQGKSTISERVKELIDLCKNQNSSMGNELLKVLGDQRNIYNDLVNSNRNSSQKTHYFGTTNPIIEAQKESSVVQGSRQQQISNISSGNQSPTKVNIPPKSSIRQVIEKNPKFQVGDDLIQMIEQIERKALNEIQKLREEKIDLMKQLKQQIQSNNQLQKQVNNFSQQNRNQRFTNQIVTPFRQSGFGDTFQKNNVQQQMMSQIRIQMENLRRQNDNLRINLSNRSQINPQFSQIDNNEVINLRNRVGILQNQLRNRQQLIQQLNLQISKISQLPITNSGNSQQVNQLLEQGQAIRQNTLHLIRLKEGQKGVFNENQRIQQLQQLLQKEEEEKQSFLNDLLAFKQKYQQLEEENRHLKRQSKYTSTDLTKLSPIMDKSVNNNVGASLDDYEKLLYQMRGNRY